MRVGGLSRQAAAEDFLEEVAWGRSPEEAAEGDNVGGLQGWAPWDLGGS